MFKRNATGLLCFNLVKKASFRSRPSKKDETKEASDARKASSSVKSATALLCFCFSYGSPPLGAARRCARTGAACAAAAAPPAPAPPPDAPPPRRKPAPRVRFVFRALPSIPVRQSGGGVCRCQPRLHGRPQRILPAAPGPSRLPSTKPTIARLLLFSTLHPRPVDAWTRVGVAIYAAWR